MANPHALRISLRVNGETRQDASTADMVFKIPGIIESLSSRFTLLPGDIVATGTPEGVGPVVDGDVMEAEVEGIGKLVNRVVFAK